LVLFRIFGPSLSTLFADPNHSFTIIVLLCAPDAASLTHHSTLQVCFTLPSLIFGSYDVEVMASAVYAEILLLYALRLRLHVQPLRLRLRLHAQPRLSVGFYKTLYRTRG